MLLQFAIVMISLHVGTAQRIVAVNQEGLKEEFRQQVREVIEQTTTNVSRCHQLQCGIEGAALRDEISEQTNTTLEFIAESNREHESTAEELKECIRKDLDAGLRKVNEGVETTVIQAVDRAVNSAVEAVTEAVETRVSMIVRTTVTEAVDEISEQTNTTLELIAESNREHESTAEELKECIRKDLDAGLRKVNEGVVTTVIQAVGTAVSTAVETAVRTTVVPAVDRAVTTAVDRAVTEVVNRVVTGYYRVKPGNRPPVQVYCSMTVCADISGGWIDASGQYRYD